MKAQQLCFLGPHQVEIREQQLPSLQPDQVLVKNLYSAISAGTEMLVYRGQLPTAMSRDESLAASEAQTINYPTQYGYACVGRIEEVGQDVDNRLPPVWGGVRFVERRQGEREPPGCLRVRCAALPRARRAADLQRDSGGMLGYEEVCEVEEALRCAKSDSCVPLEPD